MKYQVVGYTFKKFSFKESCLYVGRLILADSFGLRLQFLISVKNENGTLDYSVGHENIFELFRILLFRKGFKNITLLKLYKCDNEKLILKMLDNLLGFVVFDDQQVYLTPLFCGWDKKLIYKYNENELLKVIEEKPYDYVVLINGFKYIPNKNIRYVNPKNLEYFKSKIDRITFNEYTCAINNFDKKNNEDGLGITGTDCFFFTSMVLPIFNSLNCNDDVLCVSKPFYKLMKYVVKKYKLEIELKKKKCACEIRTKRSKKVLVFYENKKTIKYCKNNFDKFELFTLSNTPINYTKYKVTRGEIQDVENPLLIVLVLAMMCDCCLDCGMYKISVNPKTYKDNKKLIDLFIRGVTKISNIKFLV